MVHIHPATASDEPFLWNMLAIAAHMNDAGESPESAKTDPFLSRYVSNWGQPGDLGFIAYSRDKLHRPISAAWCRVLPPVENGLGYVSGDIPELAIATDNAYQGQGAGRAVLGTLIQAAKEHYPGLSLNVRIGNPAQRLYEQAGFRTVPDSEVTNRVGGRSITMVLMFQPPTAQDPSEALSIQSSNI